VSWGDHI